VKPKIEDLSTKEITTKKSPATLLRAALGAAARGFPVFPCVPRDKIPLVAFGFYSSTTDPRIITWWWTRTPAANLAVWVRDFMVLDVDPRHGGPESLARLEAQFGSLPETLEVRSGGNGSHRWFDQEVGITNTVGRLGPGLDVKTGPAYVMLPPSVHPSGKRYEWVRRVAPAKLPPRWVKLMIEASAPEGAPAGANGAAGPIPEGQRNATLTALGGAIRRRGCSESEVLALLLAANTARCQPPLPEREVTRIAQSVSRYPAGVPNNCSHSWARDGENPWAAAEPMSEFLKEAEDIDVILDKLIYPGSVTEIFSPRGAGKSLYAGYVAGEIGRKSKRVLILDRDNPRHITKRRLRCWGITPETPLLKALSRDKCPPLTDTRAWAAFPYSDYDAVIVDSLETMTEGTGEQDSAKPARAMASLLDVARREKSAGFLILGNDIKTGEHSRGNGVIENRADVVYEVRDVCGFTPSGNKPWVEELPNASAAAWAGRSVRRKQRDKYRLAFIPTKFRGGQEPEPFIVEIDTTAEPWTCIDVTDAVDAEGAAARKSRADQEAAVFAKAVDELKAEIVRRMTAHEPELHYTPAQDFLVSLGFKRKMAREVIAVDDFEKARTHDKGNPQAIRIGVKSSGTAQEALGQEPRI
jgi:hypothetical protein